MKKNAYLKALREELADLPEEEREDLLADYEEHFAAGKQNGRTETEIGKALGTPAEVAEQVRAERQTAPKQYSRRKKMLIIAGLLVFNLFVGLEVIGGISMLLFSGIVGAGAIIVGGFVTALAPILPYAQMLIHPAASVLLGLGLIFLGALGLIIMCVLARLFWRGLRWYARTHIKIVNGEYHA